ncbi:hypothetical protein [Candidatus Mycobacterium methanotrophicum]|uniref:Uncharacterized protein n=1 Tax=Candidatus Mycobacterium methanotrophicum TaxID=2943498 RepID=A0ABY4QHP4_9MYCO|nr:hypothetical protein [Candidatus Mycobacterium methanotrophicum]UQX09348.1 hypothetical protein M5I08_12955 [Candidatus Mycobacterium methanotrophicum]
MTSSIQKRHHHALLPAHALSGGPEIGARGGYGPGARNGDIPAAQDAIADALERALTRWPAEGIPV